MSARATSPISVPTPHPARWTRFLRPSFTDLFLLAFLSWSFLAGPSGWVQLLADGDTGLHVRLGDFMREHSTVPTTDMFSFAKVGQEWFAFEWLSEVWFSILNSSYGLRGLVFFCGALIGVFTTLQLLFTLHRGTNAFLAVVLVLMSANATSIHYLARPHLFTLLFLTVTAWLIDDDRRRQTMRLWFLVPLVVLWANLHGGFFILFPYLSLLIVGQIAEAYLAPASRQERLMLARRYALLLVACLGASLINPYGIKLHQHIAETMTAKWLVVMVNEFQSPEFRSENMMLFMVLLFAGLAVGGQLLRERKITEVLWLLFFAYCALISVRHTNLYTLIAVPIIGAELTAWWSGWVGTLSRKSVPAIVDDIAQGIQGRFGPIGLCSGVVIASAWLLTPASFWPTDFPDVIFPVKLTAKYGSRLATSRLYTTDRWGGFLIFHNYPKQRVFLDGRHNYYGVKLATEYMQLSAGHPDWKKLLDRYRFDSVLLSPDTSLVTLLKMDPEWQVVASDEQAVLLERRSAAGPGAGALVLPPTQILPSTP